MSPTFFRIIALVILGFILLPAPLHAELSAMGTWEFDEDRRELYVNSVRAGQRGGAMPEIAAEMALAKIENTTFTFGSDARGPHLIRTDKTTGEAVRKPITVRRDGQDLIMTEEASGSVFRLHPVDKDHLTMIDEVRKVTIPLKRG
jgi:hypothetical protein